MRRFYWSLIEKYGVMKSEWLKNIRNHKYTGGAYTPLDHLYYRYWWDPALNLIPLWVAPNVITFVGFIIALGSCIPVFVYVSLVMVQGDV